MTPVNRKPRPLLGLLAIIAVPSLAMIDTAIALERGWAFWSRVNMACFALLVAVIVGALLAFAIPRSRAFLGRRSMHLVLLCSTVIVILVVIEATLHFFAGPLLAAQVSLRPPNQHYVFRPRPEIMPGITGESNYRTNAQGIRGDPWPPRESAVRLLCIGGSSCECAYLDDAEMWPRILQDRLNGRDPAKSVWVGNAGISGATTIDHVRVSETCDVFRHIDGAIFFFGLNDFQRHLAGNLIDISVAPYWQRSGLWTLLFQVYARSKLEGGMAEDIEGTVYEVRRQNRRAARIVDELPDLTDALGRYRARVERLVAVSREHGVRPVFVTQPVLWDARLSPKARDLLLLGLSDRPDGAYYSVAVMRAGMDRYNALLIDTCRALGVECIDASVMNGDERFFYDDCHLTEAGARRLADLMADHVAQLPLK